VLHGRAEFGGERVATTNFPTADDPSLFVGVDLDAAARAIYDETAKQTDVVFMSGVSAWSSGQLDNELKQGSWVAVKAPVSLALNAPGELWQDLMRTLGGEYAEMSCMPSMEEEEE
uniref:YqgE/AlgH family protein n=2 Tax=Phytophthora ramorum TaxID=164328 RepID=H3HBX9_PHYRM